MYDYYARLIYLNLQDFCVINFLVTTLLVVDFEYKLLKERDCFLTLSPDTMSMDALGPTSRGLPKKDIPLKILGKNFETSRSMMSPLSHARVIELFRGSSL